MIKDALVSDTYSEALFRECIERKLLEVVRDDLEGFSLVLKQTPKLCRFLEGPQFLTEDKTGLLDKVFSGSLNELSMSFLKLLIVKNRIEYFLDIFECFSDKILTYEGYVEVDVVSAVKLYEDEVVKLRKKLSDMLDSKVSLDTKVNPYILGGIVIRIGHKLIDASLRRRLNEIRTNLMDAKVH